MAWRLKYGAGSLNLETPPEFSVRMLASAAITPLLDPTQAVRDALDAPTGSPRLRDLAAGARHVMIVVPTPSYASGLTVTLLQVLDVLQDSGVGLRQAEILVAAGAGRRWEADEMEAMVGSEVWNRVAVRQHDADDPAGFEDMGETERGTPLLINRKAAVGGQLLILAGALAPKPIAGFTGGPSLVLPGLSARASILAQERLGLPDGGTELAPGARAAEMEDNPLFQDALEAADKLEPDFLVHTVSDEDGRMLKVVAGDWRKAVDAGCEWVRTRLRVSLQEPRGWVVAAAGGGPLDRTLAAAAGGLLEAARATRDGGRLVFAAACPDGLGSEALASLSGPSAAELGSKLSQAPIPGGLLALSLRSQAERIRVTLVSQLPAEVVRGLGMEPAETLEAAWTDIAAAHEGGAHGYVIPAASRLLIDAAWQREVLVVEHRPATG